MSKKPDEKRIMILEAAKRRFSHYGMAKTTMAEIAKDLSFSKALLYYYFPDKNSLYCSVLEYLMEEFSEVVKPLIVAEEDTERAVIMLIDKRMEFIRKYYYIIEFPNASGKDASSELQSVLGKAFEAHRQEVVRIFKKGIDKGELKNGDVEEISKLFVFATAGMRLMVVKDIKFSFVPTKEEFEYIATMQKKLALIFIEGLRV